MWVSSVFDFLFSLPKVHGRYLLPPIQLAPDPSAVLCLGTLRADTLWHHSLDRQNKLDIVKAMMDCLLAKAIPCVTDCVVAELEKLGPKYRVALRLSKDPRFQRLPCSHQGTYADDCLVQVGFILCIYLFFSLVVVSTSDSFCAVEEGWGFCCDRECGMLVLRLGASNP